MVDSYHYVFAHIDKLSENKSIINTRICPVNFRVLNKASGLQVSVRVCVDQVKKKYEEERISLWIQSNKETLNMWRGNARELIQQHNDWIDIGTYIDGYAKGTVDISVCLRKQNNEESTHSCKRDTSNHSLTQLWPKPKNIYLYKRPIKKKKKKIMDYFKRHKKKESFGEVKSSCLTFKKKMKQTTLTQMF